MLKAAIIYVPGTGGSFLRRVFSMSATSIVTDPEQQITLEQKFELFNTWRSDRWKAGENQARPGFRSGADDFYLYENSALSLVDAWHPAEFLQHEQAQQCWIAGAWQHLIFVTVGEQHRSFVEQNQTTKFYQVKWGREQAAMQQLQETYAERSAQIAWDDVVDYTRFESAVRRIDQELGLGLEIDLAVALWPEWYKKSQETWL